MPTVDIASLFGGTPSNATKVECRVGFGKSNFATSLTTFAAMTVAAPFRRTSALMPMHKVKGGFDASFLVGAIPEFGSISICDVSYVEGTIILLQVSGKRGGAALRDGVLFIRLREHGPEWEVFGKLPNVQQNTLGDRALLFKGRGDVLGAEALAAEGIEAPGSYVAKFMQPEEIEECFLVTRTKPEIAARPKVVAIEKADGTVVHKELPTAPKRRMNMRRKK